MSYKYNNKFAYATFEEEARSLNNYVHVLTFQSNSMYEQLLKTGKYIPDPHHDSRAKGDEGYYVALKRQLGYMPIWVFNPLWN